MVLQEQKTLLAKAIAGEANVFFQFQVQISLKCLLELGLQELETCLSKEKHSPCIIFIDEIDAVGRSRGAGLGGGNDEREQTLNQLLVEMDGLILMRELY